MAACPAALRARSGSSARRAISAAARATRWAARRHGRGSPGKAAAEWLATVNLSHGSTHDYAFKTLPRPSGRATRMIVTEYDLPRSTIEPHDVVVDADGMVGTGLRRAVRRQDGPEDREGDRVSDSADQGRLPRRNARPRVRP